MSITIGQWNMLASSMAYGEFLSADDERTFLPWGLRKDQVVDVIKKMFVKGCDFVVVIENDRPWEILAALNDVAALKDLGIAGVAVVDPSD